MRLNLDHHMILVQPEGELLKKFSNLESQTNPIHHHVNNT